MPSSTEPHTEQFRRVLIWRGWFRLAHWSIALSSLVLIGSGWLVAESPSLAESASEFHSVAASVLLFGLLLRVLLMFVGKNHERLNGLIVDASEFRSIGQMFRYYLSLGRAPLPNWYAQNPLWKSIYLFMYLALWLQVISGFLMPDNDVLYGFYLPSVHTWWARVIGICTALHLVTVVMHDYRGKAADISAMISGYRFFQLGGDQVRNRAEQNTQVVTLDISKRI